MPEAKYWFDIFGPKIIVECNNDPHGRLRTVRYGGRRISPVKKLYDVLRRSKAKLGLLLSTGPLRSRLWDEAKRRASLDRLVVLFDGRDIEGIIDSPGDAIAFFKERVSNGAIRASPSSSLEVRGH